MKLLVFLFLLCFVLSCSEDSSQKKTSVTKKSGDAKTKKINNKPFLGEKITGEALPQKTLDCFYPIDTIAKIYVYRDIVGGLEEQFHRVQSLITKKGEVHVIVQVYSSDLRMLETLNYIYPSLELYDHLVANRKKESARAEVFKNKMFPKTNGLKD